VAEAEKARCRGDVDEAHRLMKLWNQLRDERDTLRRTVAVSNNSNDHGTLQKAIQSYKKSQYLDELLCFCQKSLADLQARIKKAKERLILTQQAKQR
jgi:hypothetical protein